MRKAYKLNSKKILKKDQKNKGNKISYLKLFFAVFLAYFLYTMYTQQLQINKYNSQITMYQQDITSVSKLNKYYESQEASMQTDEFIEKMAREKLGYVKPYEKIFVDINKK